MYEGEKRSIESDSCAVVSNSGREQSQALLDDKVHGANRDPCLGKARRSVMGNKQDARHQFKRGSGHQSEGAGLYPVFQMLYRHREG